MLDSFFPYFLGDSQDLICDFLINFIFSCMDLLGLKGPLDHLVSPSVQ